MRSSEMTAREAKEFPEKEAELIALREELTGERATVAILEAKNSALRRVVDLIMWEVAHFTQLGRVVQMTPEVWNSLADLLEPKPQEGKNE